MRRIVTQTETNYYIRRVIDGAFGIITFIIATRFLLKLFGANAGNALVEFVYALSSIFVFPYKGIFANLTISDNLIFETASIIALIVLSILYGFIIRLFPRKTVEFIQ